MENENNEQNLNVEPEVAQGTYTDQVVYDEPMAQIPVEQMPVNEASMGEIPMDGVQMEGMPIQEVVVEEPQAQEMTEEEYQAKLEEKRQEIIKKRDVKMKISVVLILIGFIMTIVGVSLAVANQQKGKGFIATTGTVYEVNSKTTADGEAFAPSIKYDVEGTIIEYASTEYEVGKNYKVGDEINLKYDPENPYDVVLGVGKTSPIIFVVAAIFVIIGLILNRI